MTVRPRAWIGIGALIAALVGLGAFVEGNRAFAALKFAIQRSPDLMPSTAAVPDGELRPGIPTVSLALPAEALHDRLTGILANKLGHGREWERMGTVSFFEGTRLAFSTPVGVRVHGGGSRLTSPRQGFRLYFRRQYGRKELPAGVVFGPPHDHPLRRLILHNDMRCSGEGDCWHLINPLAYDITTQIGGIAAATRPVRFFLNGEFYGVFVLTEHFHFKHYFQTHFGHPVSLDGQEFDDLWRQLSALRPLRMANAARLIDLDSLTRWFIATVFCATGDPFQGPGQFRDPARTEGQWFFVNWDMDAGSFHDPTVDSFARLLEGGASFRARRRNDPRPYVMTRLLREDPEFRARFKAIWVDVMNFRLTPAFLRGRFEYYRDIATRYGVEHLDYLPRLETFLRERPDHVWKQAERYVSTGARRRVFVRATARPVRIDGNIVNAGFDGFYFPGMRVTLDVRDEDRARFSYWVVNGVPQPRGQAALALNTDQSLEIAAIWK